MLPPRTLDWNVDFFSRPRRWTAPSLGRRSEYEENESVQSGDMPTWPHGPEAFVPSGETFLGNDRRMPSRRKSARFLRISVKSPFRSRFRLESWQGCGFYLPFFFCYSRGKHVRCLYHLSVANFPSPPVDSFCGLTRLARLLLLVATRWRAQCCREKR